MLQPYDGPDSLSVSPACAPTAHDPVRVAAADPAHGSPRPLILSEAKVNREGRQPCKARPLGRSQSGGLHTVPAGGTARTSFGRYSERAARTRPRRSTCDRTVAGKRGTALRRLSIDDRKRRDYGSRGRPNGRPAGREGQRPLRARRCRGIAPAHPQGPSR